VPRFIVVEDDHLQEAPLQDYLTSVFPDSTVETISTEEDFRLAMPAMRANIPDLVVLDVMLRWSFPRPNPPKPPKDVLSGGYYRAGLRCAQLLQEDALLRDVPVVLYTILELNDLLRDGQQLPPNSTYVGKNSELDVLVRHIRGVLRKKSRTK